MKRSEAVEIMIKIKRECSKHKVCDNCAFFVGFDGCESSCGVSNDITPEEFLNPEGLVNNYPN